MRHNAARYFEEWSQWASGDMWDLCVCIPGLKNEVLGSGSAREILGGKLPLNAIMPGVYVDMSKLSLMNEDAVQHHETAMSAAEKLYTQMKA